jgi:hypothetical protein
MVADAFHQIASLDRPRAAYAAPRWDWVQHAFTSCIFNAIVRRIGRREIFKYWVQAKNEDIRRHGGDGGTAYRLQQF